MKNSIILFVESDMRKNTIDIAVAENGHNGKRTRFGRRPGLMQQLDGNIDCDCLAFPMLETLGDKSKCVGKRQDLVRCFCRLTPAVRSYRWLSRCVVPSQRCTVQIGS